MHRFHCHPAEVNAERLATLPTKKLVWTQEEMDGLLRHANGAWKEGMSKTQIFTSLMPHFPGRSAEAIKKRLQSLKWAPPRANPERNSQPLHATSGNVAPATLPTPDPSRVDNQGANMEDPAASWRRALLAAAADHLKEPKLGAGTLKQITQDLLNGKISSEECRMLMCEHAQHWFPHTWKPSLARPEPKTRQWKVREMRRANYAAVQTLYKRNRRDAAQAVFSGSWRNAYRGRAPQPDKMDQYWAEVFETASATDVTPPGSPSDIYWSVVSKITPSEVADALKGMRNSAPGLDRITAEELLTWDHPSLAAYYNLMMAAGGPPEHLACSRVTFIPKVENPQTPGDYRPISVASTVLRAFHKILAWRLRDTLQLSPFQHGFLQRDGCLEATALLHTILRKVHNSRKPCAMLFLDVAKAFDTVSHQTLFRVAVEMGLPPPLVNYLKHLYSQSTVRLADKATKCGRGVRQGDPLSPLLFIMVMDDIVRKTLPEVGFDLDGQRVDSLAYADDLVLLAEKSPRLQDKLHLLSEALRKAGMSLNARKSRGLTVTKVSKRKQMVLTPTTYECEGETIKPMGTDDSVRYLGLHFNWKGRIVPKHTGKLDSLLKELTKAPLKPYQRLQLLKFHAVPKYTHELVLGHAHRNTLKKLDCLTRAAVRRWLRLPKDTPLGYLHANVKDGGLGIPCFSTSIPLLQKKRFEKIATNPATIFQIMQRQDSFRTQGRRLDKPCRLNSTVVTSKTEVREEWGNMLSNSIDGRELRHPEVDKASHEWLLRPDRVFPRLHMRGIQLRGGLLPTKARSGRGNNRQVTSKTCRGACQNVETLNHILQVCEVTHDARCARHNRVLHRLERLLHKKGLRTTLEPVIPAGSSFIKPDLIIETDTHTYVLDVSVVAGYRMTESWDIKVEKYGRPDRVEAIRKWAAIPATKRVEQLPVIVSNRGLCYQPSGDGLRALGLTSRDISDLCLLTIHGSLRCYDLYTRGTRAV
ncbi:hypothetical protein Chor_008348 [Crotalus horridus]